MTWTVLSEDRFRLARLVEQLQGHPLNKGQISLNTHFGLLLVHTRNHIRLTRPNAA